MTVAKRVALRLLVALGIAWAASSLAWLLTVTLPGDAMDVVVGPQASPADVERARAVYGEDRPLVDRYLTFERRLLHGASADLPHDHCADVGLGLHTNLGYSFTYNQPVVKLIEKKLPRSIELAVAAVTLQLLLSLTLGIVAALKKGTRTDDVIVGGVTALSATPTFVIGIFLQMVLAHRLGLLPIDGAGPTPGLFTPYIVLPAATLGLFGVGLVTRLVRREVLQAATRPFVLAARARGGSRPYVFVRHALRHAIAPIAELGILELGALIGGAIVTEKLFRWPGIGDLAVTAIQNRDAELVLALTLVAGVVMCLATALADVVRLLLDPRARAAE